MDDIKTFESGAASSGEAARFDLIPRSILQKLALRFGLGARKYGERKYRAGLADKDFIVDRLNHLQAHMQALLAPQTSAEFYDDNVGAMAWACAFLSEVEADKKGRIILAQIRAERGRVQLRMARK